MVLQLARFNSPDATEISKISREFNFRDRWDWWNQVTIHTISQDKYLQNLLLFKNIKKIY